MARLAAGVILALCPAIAACATMARGTTEAYSITTDPAGAIATLSTGSSCVTPCKVVLGRRDEVSVVLRLAGYREQRVELTTRLSSSGLSHAVENVGNAGVGILVDAATGATLEHVPQQISVVLTR